MSRSLAALLLGLLALAIPTAGWCQAEAPDPLLCAIPPQTLFAAVGDMRSDTESMKLLAAGQTPEQRAAIRASAVRGLRQLLTAMGGDLDVEKEILSWLTGRFALCSVPPNGKGEPGLLLLLETQGGEETTRRIEGLMKGGVAVGQLEVAPAVEEIPVWKAAKVSRGTAVTYMEPILMLSSSDACLGQSLKHMKAINAGGAAAPVTQALVSAPPGFVRFALAPAVFEMAQKAGAKLLAINRLAGSARFDKAGLLVEVDMGARPDAGAWKTLANLRPTFSESVAGIPDNALFAMVAQRPAVWLHALGIPILDGIAAGDLGPRPVRAVGSELAQILSDLLGQEVALGVVQTDEKPSLLAVFTSARAADFARAVDTLIQSGKDVNGLRFTPAPLGDSPGWVARLGAGPGSTEVHLAVEKGRLLAGGSRKALEIGAATLNAGTGSVAKAAWFTEGTEFLGPKPLARGAINTRALGPVLAGLMGGQGSASAKAVQPFLETLFSGVGRMVGGMRLDGATLRVVNRVELDYPKVAALAGMVVPAATGFAVARVTAPRKGQPAAGLAPAEAPAAVQGDPQAAPCAARLRQLAQAARLYARDWGKLPPADSWVEALEPYLKDKAVLRCPADGSKRAVCYAFNSALAERPLVQIEGPEKVVLFYECASDEANPAGTGQGFPEPARHLGKHILVFADGRVDAVAEADPAWWRPEQ